MTNKYSLDKYSVARFPKLWYVWASSDTGIVRSLSRTIQLKTDFRFRDPSTGQSSLSIYAYITEILWISLQKTFLIYLNKMNYETFPVSNLFHFYIISSYYLLNEFSLNYNQDVMFQLNIHKIR